MELWKVDGAAGAERVKDINPGPASSSPIQLTASNGTLYFTAFTADTGSELWTSDGTDAGTLLFYNCRPACVLQRNDNSTGDELWAIDRAALLRAFNVADSTDSSATEPSSEQIDGCCEIFRTAEFREYDLDQEWAARLEPDYD